MRTHNLGLVPAAAVIVALLVGTAPMPGATPSRGLAPQETTWMRAFRQQMVVQEGSYHAVCAKQIHHDTVVRAGRATLSPIVSAAHDEIAASAGKASEGARIALSKSMQHATVVMDRAGLAGAFTTAADDLNTQRNAVAGEVAAWETAEAARVAAEAEAARVAAEAAAKAAKAAKKASPRAKKSEASGQTPQQYLESLASKYGTTIVWGDTACGHGSATRMAGCYNWGDSFVTVTKSAYASWSAASGLGDNVVLHEIAHFLTDRNCVSFPDESRFENATDAMSVILGGGVTGYGYNDADMAAARAALDARC